MKPTADGWEGLDQLPKDRAIAMATAFMQYLEEVAKRRIPVYEDGELVDWRYPEPGEESATHGARMDNGHADD